MAREVETLHEMGWPTDDELRDFQAWGARRRGRCGDTAARAVHVSATGAALRPARWRVLPLAPPASAFSKMLAALLPALLSLVLVGVGAFTIWLVSR